MTNDSKNYSGPGAVGAVPFSGRNSAGMQQTPGPGAAGADSPPNETLSPEGVIAYIIGLGSNASATVGPTNLACTGNGSITATGDVYKAYNSLGQRNVVVSYGTIGWP